MDTEALKAVGPLLGGALALAGGAFTFVNGRLRDAATEEERQRLLGKTADLIALVPTLLALLLVLLGARYYYAAALFVLSFILQARIFLSRPNSPSRVEFLVFSLLSAVTVASVAFALIGTILERVVDAQAQMVEIQRKTVEELRDKSSAK